MSYCVYFGVNIKHCLHITYVYFSFLTIYGRYALTENWRFGLKKTSLISPLLLKCLYQAWKVSGHVHVCTVYHFLRFWNYSESVVVFGFHFIKDTK